MMKKSRFACAVAAPTTLLLILAACSGYVEPMATWTPAAKTAECTGAACPAGESTEAESPAATPSASQTPKPEASPTRAYSLTPSNTLPSGYQFTPPSLVAQQGMIALAIRTNGFSHLWVWPLGAVEPSPLTSGEFDDRDPDFSPDGTQIAFSSRRDGNWDLYKLELPTGTLTQLTNLTGFHAHPSWSPDAKFLAYEDYADGRLRICIVSADGGEPVWCGPDSIEAFEPDWFPQPPGRMLAFTGRSGLHTDIFTINLETLEISNLTRTPNLDERAPVFSPDGARAAYSVRKDGFSWIGIIPAGGGSSPIAYTSQGAFPEWSPDGGWIAGVHQQNSNQSFLLFTPADRDVLLPAAFSVPARMEKVAWTASTLGNPVPAWILEEGEAGLLATPTSPAAGAALSEQLVRVDVKAPDARLSSAVAERFTAARQSVKNHAGWDFLGTLDSAAMDLDAPLPPRELLSWFRTGRAFAISTDAMRKGWLVAVPDSQGQAEYWRLYLRTTKQDGTQGEPLRDLPWDFDARSSGTPTAYDNGGQFFLSIPDGYYIDLTQLAADYGWQRQPADPDWRTYYYGIRYWEYICPDGLGWFSAMGELYPPREFLTPTPSASPTSRPTMRWGPPPTNTRWPTWTRTITRTPLVTRTPTPTRTPAPTLP
jgi:TolB protein